MQKVREHQRVTPVRHTSRIGRRAAVAIYLLGSIVLVNITALVPAVAAIVAVGAGIAVLGPPGAAP